MRLEMIELKPCPFCGGAAELVNRSRKGREMRVLTYSVWCQTCAVFTNWMAREKAIAVWNGRAPTVTAQDVPTVRVDG